MSGKRRSAVAEPKRITADDMEAAGRNVAARRGITVQELRDLVRNPPRACQGPDCKAAFTVYDDRQRYRSDSCKAAAGRVRNGAAS
jgi:hypothetical protein